MTVMMDSMVGVIQTGELIFGGGDRGRVHLVMNNACLWISVSFAQKYTRRGRAKQRELFLLRRIPWVAYLPSNKVV